MIIGIEDYKNTEVILMKKAAKFLSLMLSFLVFISLTAVSASAAGGMIEASDSLSFQIKFTPESDDPNASPGGEETENPAPPCSIYLVDNTVDPEKPEKLDSAVLFERLLEEDMELRLVPESGWYISGLRLTDGIGTVANLSELSLMNEIDSAIQADPENTEVSLYFSKLTDPDRPDVLDREHFFGSSPENQYTLEIDCIKSADRTLLVNFTSLIDVSVDPLTDQGNLVPLTLNADETVVRYEIPSISPDVITAAATYGLISDGILMVRQNGASEICQPGDPVSLYDNTYMILLWDTLSEQSSQPTEPQGNPPSTPTEPQGNPPSTPTEPQGNPPSTPTEPLGNPPSTPAEPQGNPPGLLFGNPPSNQQGGQPGTNTNSGIEIPSFTITANDDTKQ